MTQLTPRQNDILNNIKELYTSEQKYAHFLRTVIDQVIFRLAPTTKHATQIMNIMTQIDEKTRWLLPPTYNFNYDLRNIECARGTTLTGSNGKQLPYFAEEDWTCVFSGLPNIYIFSVRLLSFLWDF